MSFSLHKGNITNTLFDAQRFPLLQGDIVGELFLDHATANKCKEPEEFKKAMATLVDNVHKLTLHLGKVKLYGK